MEAGQKNVATSSPKCQTGNSLVLKTGRKHRVPLAKVNGSTDSNEENEQTNAKKKTKEKSQTCAATWAQVSS